MATKWRRCSTLGLGALLAVFALTPARAQPLSGAALVQALRQGGHVLVIRHNSSPRTPPDAQTADKANVNLERQLDDTGRATVKAMGEAIAKLKIPLGEVLSSPTYRAMESARLAGFKTAKPTPELGDGGQSMVADTEGKRSAWLRQKVAERPRAGTNTLLITHQPNIAGAFADRAPGVADGEAVVFRPDGQGGATPVGRIRTEEWPGLANAAP